MEYEAFSEAKIDPLGNTNDSIPSNRAQFGDESSLNSLNKSSLCSIAAQLEAELEAFHFVLSSLKVSSKITDVVKGSGWLLEISREGDAVFGSLENIGETV